MAKLDIEWDPKDHSHGWIVELDRGLRKEGLRIGDIRHEGIGWTVYVGNKRISGGYALMTSILRDVARYLKTRGGVE